MGAILPILFIVAAAAVSVTAVYVAITTLAIVAILAAVIAVSATLASVYYYVQGDIKNSMLFAGIGIAAGVGGIYVAAIGQMSYANALLAEGTAQAVLASEAAYASSAIQIYTFAQTVYAGFQTFLEAIHFKVLLQVHQVAYLVSGDYRSMLSGVMNNIAQVSEALGYGSAFMYTMLRDSRIMVMDVSSMLGNKYDMAEITWMSSLSEYMKSMKDKMQEYKDRPEAFIWDLDNSLGRTVLDLKGETMRTVWGTLEAITAGAKTLAEGVTVLKTDLARLVSNLPEVISQHFKPELDKAFRKIDDFMRLTYDPAMKAIDAALGAVGVEINKRKAEIGEIAKRLARPGEYIREVEELDDWSRMQDEASFADVSTRAERRKLEAFNEGIKAVQDEFARKIIEEELPKPPPIPSKMKEGIPPMPKKTAPKKYKSAFVGEY